MCQPCKTRVHGECDDLVMQRYAPSCFGQCLTPANPGGKQSTMAARNHERAAQAGPPAEPVTSEHQLLRPIERFRGQGGGGRGVWSYIARCSCGEHSDHKSHEINAEIWFTDHEMSEDEEQEQWLRDERLTAVERRDLLLEAGGHL